MGTTEVAINNLTPTGTPSDYVSGTGSTGELRVRIQCQTTANLTNRGDLMNIVYDTPVGPPPVPGAGSLLEYGFNEGTGHAIPSADSALFTGIRLNSPRSTAILAGAGRSDPITRNPSGALLAALLAADREPIPMRESLIALPLAHPVGNGGVIIGGRSGEIAAVGMAHRQRIAVAHLAEPLGVRALDVHSRIVTSIAGNGAPTR